LIVAVPFTRLAFTAILKRDVPVKKLAARSPVAVAAPS